MSSGVEGIEIAAGTHSDTIKSILWNTDYNIVTTADSKNLRWFDLRSQKPIHTFTSEADISSCELNILHQGNGGDSGIISVATGKSCLFFNGARPGEILKQMEFDQEIASVAINPRTRKVVTGGRNETWAHVWDLESEKELGNQVTTTKLPMPMLTVVDRSTKRTSWANLVNPVFSRW